MTARTQVALATNQAYVAGEPAERIKTLQIHGTIGSLTPADFDGLDSLEALTIAPELDEIRASSWDHAGAPADEVTIPPGLFRNLGRLRTLSLQMKGITALTEGAFDGLHRLESLSLNGNRIARIERKAFLGLNRLTTLDLGRNRLATLREGPFAFLPSLVTLNLEKNWISLGEGRPFSGNRRLISLSLADNHLRTLHPGLFFGLTRLSFLDLTKNPFGRVRVDAFKWLDSRTTLQLSMGRMTVSIERDQLSLIT